MNSGVSFGVSEERNVWVFSDTNAELGSISLCVADPARPCGLRETGLKRGVSAVVRFEVL